MVSFDEGVNLFGVVRDFYYVASVGIKTISNFLRLVNSICRRRDSHVVTTKYAWSGHCFQPDLRCIRKVCCLSVIVRVDSFWHVLQIETCYVVVLLHL